MQVLCLPPIILNIITNAFVHLYLTFYVVFVNLKIPRSLITYILIYILEAVHILEIPILHIILYCIFYPIL